MKLKRLKIKNYRGLQGENNIIEFDGVDIIFLIGKNNTGKSTFLRAYDLFVSAKSKAVTGDFFNRDTNIPIEIYGEFIVEPHDKDDAVLGKGDPEWIDKWMDDDGCVKIMKKWTAPDKEGEKMTYEPKIKHEYVKGGFGGIDTILQKYAPQPIFINAISTPEELETQINEIITKEHIKKLETNHKAKYELITNELNALKEEIAKSDDISQINSKMNTMFSKIFPQLEVEVYSVPDSGIDITKTLKATHGFKVKDKTVDLEHCDLKRNGHGVIRQAFFSYLSTSKVNLDSVRKDYLILFEEPELYLHPNAVFALRKQLYELAKDSPFQILCATHSSLMVDTAEPHASLVRLVKDEEAMSRTYQVKFNLFEGEDKRKLQMINKFNPHICEAFYADEVILVEGDTEAIIYRELIGRLYGNERGIFVLNTGSKTNMVFYQKILTHFGIKHIVVHDVDHEHCIREGKKVVNGGWTLNNDIWEQIKESNRQYPGIARRYVHFRDFESAHNYKYNTTKGKPLSAFEFAQSITKDSNLKCIEFLDDLFSKGVINHSQEDVFKFAEEEIQLNSEIPHLA